MAAAAFSESTVAAAAEAAQTEADSGTIPLKCKFCDHENQFDVKLAGKNSPCMNEECRKILKVPLLEKKGPKDWRQVEAKPSLARRDQQQLEGAWGNAETAAVSREALVGAGATERDEEEESPSWMRRIKWAALAVVAVGLLVWGVVFSLRKYDDYRAGQSMKLALTHEFKDAKTGKKNKLDKTPAGSMVRVLAATQEIDQGKAKEAKAHLEEARAFLEPINSFERAAALVEIASLLAELTGTREESHAGTRLEWDRDKLVAAVRNTLAKLPPITGEDGRDMRSYACRVMTRRLVQRNHMAGLQTLTALAGPDEHAEIMAVMGLELIELGHREKAEELAMQASASGANESAISLIALWFALSGQDAPAEKKKLAQDKSRAIASPAGKEAIISTATRVGYAEGLARQGQIQEARALAWRAGKPEERLRAGANVASAVVFQSEGKDHADLEACAKHLESELKDRPVPAWLILRLAQLSLTSGREDLAEKFISAIKDAGLKAWAQYLVVQRRAKNSEAPDFAWAEAVGDPDRIGQALAIAAVARQKAKLVSRGKVFKEINNWPDERGKLKALGFAGVALSNTESK